jgi:hypothetical protein
MRVAILSTAVYKGRHTATRLLCPATYSPTDSGTDVLRAVYESVNQDGSLTVREGILVMRHRMPSLTVGLPPHTVHPMGSPLYCLN